MGEPPAAIDPDVDGNRRLRRLYHGPPPKAIGRTRLGHAVAASACVPGLFEPLARDDLYDDITVRQVDGGVHDNQGISSLLEQDCSVIWVSDASSQLTTDRDPGGGVLRPLLRSNAILMERVRAEQHRGREARRAGALLEGLRFLHLERDLEAGPVDWMTCDEPAEDRPSCSQSDTCHGIREEIQELLSSVRTDLDSFCDAEAHALMTSGYLMAKQYATDLKSLPQEKPPEDSKWDFLRIAPVMSQVGDNKMAARDLWRLLEIAGRRTFKVWHISCPLRMNTGAVAVTAVALLVVAVALWPSQVAGAIATIVSVLGWLVTVGMVGLAAGAALIRVPGLCQSLERVAIGFGIGLFGRLAAWIHLRLFDPLYLRLGQVDTDDRGTIRIGER